MKKVVVFQTSDGIVHPLLHAAKHHADERYGAALTSICHKLVGIDKYVHMMGFVESNLDLFVEIKGLRDDITLAKDPDDDDGDCILDRH